MSQLLSGALEADASLPPLVLRWSSLDELPMRRARSLSQPQQRMIGLEAPPWYDSGDLGKPFNFTDRIRRLTEDIALRCPELSHIDVSRLLFSMTQARKNQAHGLQARVTPMRFHEGNLLKRRRQSWFQVQRFVVNDIDMLYLVTFCLPRFLEQSFEEKMITLFHELYHISPRCDGDLRKHKGRYSIHTHSKREYDAQMAGLARAYLATRPDPSLFDFLRLNFAQLQYRHRSVHSVVLPQPKVIPVMLYRVEKR